MARTSKKSSANNRNNKKRKLGLKPKPEQSHKQKLKKQPKPTKSKNPNPNPSPDPNEEDPILFGSGSGSGSESDSPSSSSPTQIHALLEPYSKPQLISFLLDAAPSDPELLARIRSLADSDPSHRKIFVHGLAWDATSAQLMDAFSPFGPVEDCSVVIDRATGRAKGYGFVLFKTRSAAAKALKEPQKRIGSRMAACQLASIGGAKPEGGRKVYVGNVPADARPERLREFFGRFGEIESGPIGFDAVTGKSKGYAIFVYKSKEEAMKALEEPYRVFEGHQLHCKLANVGPGDGGVKASLPVLPQVPAVVPAVGAVPAALPAQQSVFAAVAATQNLALLSHNPAYAALLAQNPILAQNPLLAAAALNPALVNATALGGMTGVPYGGGVTAPSVVGAYGTGQGMGAVGSQGLQGYPAGPSLQAGQTSGARAGGALGGFPSSSYVW